jgi:hypothetical protein
MWIIVPQTRWHFLKVLIFAMLVVPAFFIFTHLQFARSDLDGLNSCTRRGAITNCTGLYGTYDQIVADCVAWPPVFTERLSEYTERLCNAVLSEKGTS